MFSLVSGQTNRIRWESLWEESFWLVVLITLSLMWSTLRVRRWPVLRSGEALQRGYRLWAMAMRDLDKLSVWVWLNWIRMHWVGGVKIILLNCLSVNRPVHPHNLRGKCKHFETALPERLELHCLLPRYPNKVRLSILSKMKPGLSWDENKNVIWIAEKQFVRVIKQQDSALSRLNWAIVSQFYVSLFVLKLTKLLYPGPGMVSPPSSCLNLPTWAPPVIVTSPDPPITRLLILVSSVFSLVRRLQHRPLIGWWKHLIRVRTWCQEEKRHKAKCHHRSMDDRTPGWHGPDFSLVNET